jgi:hypothetical protein
VGATEAEHLWKEQDDLLRSVELEHDLARQERANAQEQIDQLESELQGERDLKVAAEGVTARLAAHAT